MKALHQPGYRRSPGDAKRTGELAEACGPGSERRARPAGKADGIRGNVGSQPATPAERNLKWLSALAPRQAAQCLTQVRGNTCGDGLVEGGEVLFGRLLRRRLRGDDGGAQLMADLAAERRRVSRDPRLPVAR